MKEVSYNFSRARSEQQRLQMEDLEKRGVCAFCVEHLDQEHREPIEFMTDHWVVTKNDYPYKRTKIHLLLLSKVHVKTLSELSSEALLDLMNTIVRIEKDWKLSSYAVGIRSGNMFYNGGSVEHLHVHIVVGDPENEDPEPVRFKMSSRPKT
jgi:ATP adenylyltransferase